METFKVKVLDNDGSSGSLNMQAPTVEEKCCSGLQKKRRKLFLESKEGSLTASVGRMIVLVRYSLFLLECCGRVLWTRIVAKSC